MKKYIALLAGISIVLLTGCGSGADQSTVSIDGKGKVTAMTVESFDKSWYDFGELEQTVDQAVADYNGQHEKNSIRVKTCKQDEKAQTVTVTLEYASCEDYRAFNQRELYRGTVKETQEEYGLPEVFLDRKEKEVQAKAVLAYHPDAQAILLQEPVTVKTPEEILYVSGNVTITGENTARVEDDGMQDNENADTSIYEYAYIIYLNEK